MCILVIFITHLLALTLWAFLRPGSSSRGFRITDLDVAVAFLVMMLPLGITLHFAGVTSVRQFVDVFRLRAPKREHLAGALALGFLTQAIAIEILGGGLEKLQFRWRFDWVLVAMLLAPFQEEPVMRGYLYTAFRTRYSFAKATLVVTLLYLIMHLPLLLSSFSGVSFAVPTAAIGIAACVLRERTGNLWPAIALHLGYNAIPAGIMWSL